MRQDWSWEKSAQQYINFTNARSAEDSPAIDPELVATQVPAAFFFHARPSQRPAYRRLGDHRGKSRARAADRVSTALPKNSNRICPFCVGNERQTPTTIKAYHNGRKERWLVRVVQNKYPALTGCQPNGSSFYEHELFQSTPAVGHHEVIIESPRHVVSFSELTDDEASYSLQAYIDAVTRCRATQHSHRCRSLKIVVLKQAHHRTCSLAIRFPAGRDSEIQPGSRLPQLPPPQGKLLQHAMLEFELSNSHGSCISRQFRGLLPLRQPRAFSDLRILSGLAARF